MYSESQNAFGNLAWIMFCMQPVNSWAFCNKPFTKTSKFSLHAATTCNSIQPKVAGSIMIKIWQSTVLGGRRNNRIN